MELFSSSSMNCSGSVGAPASHALLHRIGRVTGMAAAASLARRSGDRFRARARVHATLPIGSGTLASSSNPSVTAVRFGVGTAPTPMRWGDLPSTADPSQIFSPTAASQETQVALPCAEVVRRLGWDVVAT
ncbi:hypothetical protein L1887_52993 [Cichorium endivia]|nr:hypothetical protein L1887_52993 [Cichorium endivia]